ncbi:hypothetical protein V5799_029617 [Amblyomma americanum]|uniref:Neurotransmitter-gated ion-channel ligand-binding domain-containing protein n=1 Tax=Amblyomma americanum TaxID=6943 RepID=A0AAQ4ER05_AMBAM
MRCALLFLSVFLASFLTVAQTGQPESSGYVPAVQEIRRRLLRDSGYDPSTRPANDSSKPTAIHVVIPLVEVNYVSLEDEWFTVALYFCKFWKDHRLSWNKEDFDGTNRISGSTDEIWWPRVDVVNARRGDVDTLQDKVNVYSGGHVWSCDAMRVKIPCSMDLSDFPNDKQACSLQVASSAYSDSQVNMVGDATWGSRETNTSSEWILDAISFRNHTELNRSFVDVIFHLRRLGSRYRFTVTVPAVASALVMLAAFWMPPDSDRRLTVACLNFLFLALMLYRIAELMGDSIKVPKIMMILALAAAVEMLTVVESALVISISRSNAGVRVPDAINRLLTDTCGTVLCLSRSDWRNVSSNTSYSQETPTFDEWQERKQRWLTLAQAVDRILFLVFGLMAMGFFL